MINILDLAQTCLAFLLIRRVARSLQWELLRGCGGGAPSLRKQLGVWGRSPFGSKILCLFGKNNLVLGLF